MNFRLTSSVQPTRANLRLYGLIAPPDGLGEHASTCAISTLEHGDRISATAKLIRGIEAAHAGADHENVLSKGLAGGGNSEDGQDCFHY
jgi:hypothetical protein